MKKPEFKISRKMIIAGGIALAATAAVIVILVCLLNKEDTRETYKDVAVSRVHMERTLTSAGKITTGKSETVALNKGKVFKGAAVETNQQVVKGQALAYYTDGTHTDAPADGIITSISVPERGKQADDSHSIELGRTKIMYMKITVPQEEINEISKGSNAVVIVNALPGREFPGTIEEKNDVPDSFLKKNKENKENENGTDDDEDTDESDDTGDDESEETEAYDMEDDEGEDGEDGEGNNSRYTITIKFKNNGEVRSGMSAGCVITISDRYDVVAVPVQAVQYDEEDRAYVEKVNGNKIEKVPVETGESDPMNVEIVNGVKIGDKVRVIVNGGGKSK